MSGERHASELNHQRILSEIDKELKAALSVMPSATFEARVLRRMEERAATPRHWSPSYALLGAAAAVIIATAIAVQMNRSGEGQTPVPQVATALSVPGIEPLSETAMAAGVMPIPLAPKMGWSERPASAAAPEPEVIVPREHAEAVRRFMRAIAEARIKAAMAPDETVPVAPETVVVTPLIVKPIPIPAVEGLGGVTPVVRGLQ